MTVSRHEIDTGHTNQESWEIFNHVQEQVNQGQTSWSVIRSG